MFLSHVHRSSPTRSQKGFTLIEMAIVLIIIGIIIGAIIKGKDIIKGGEQKKLYTKFLNAWQMAYSAYYDRTGWILADLPTGDNKSPTASRDGHCDDSITSENLDKQLKSVGLEPPPVGTTGKSTERNFTDSKGEMHTLVLTFDFDTNLGNVIRVTSTKGVPVELGIAWDRIVDEVRGGESGDLLYTTNYTSSPMATPIDWPSAEEPGVPNAAIILKLPF